MIIYQYIIQQTITQIPEPLVFISNKSLEIGLFHVKEKLAKVIQVFKKGDKCDLSNLHISHLRICSC